MSSSLLISDSCWLFGGWHLSGFSNGRRVGREKPKYFSYHLCASWRGSGQRNMSPMPPGPVPPTHSSVIPASLGDLNHWAPVTSSLCPSFLRATVTVCFCQTLGCLVVPCLASWLFHHLCSQFPTLYNPFASNTQSGVYFHYCTLTELFRNRAKKRKRKQTN